MSMYLPNPAVRSAESDPVEFIDVTSMRQDHGVEARIPVEAHTGAGMRLTSRAQVELTRRAHDSIAALVASYGGDGQDLRAVIVDLYDQITVGDHATPT
jgi:hypothetical protein